MNISIQSDLIKAQAELLTFANSIKLDEVSIKRMFDALEETHELTIDLGGH